MRKYIVYGLLVLSFILIPMYRVSAKTLAEFKKELNAAESKYSSTETKKSETKADINKTKDKINSINSEKKTVSIEIDKLNKELQELGEKIEKMQDEIKRIVHYYQVASSDSIYLEYVFNATDFTDFIYRLAVAEQLSEYREKTIKEYNDLMEQNRKKLNELAAKQTSLGNLESQLSTELSKLNSDLSDLVEISVDTKEEISELKSTISTYENKYGCSQNEEVAACVTRYNNAIEAKRRAASGSSNNGGGSSYSGTPISASGFHRPVTAGRVNANYGYTAYYGSFHDGMDIGVSHGTPVYAIANGYVAKISPRSSCGGNMVYIVHNVNGRTYTSGYFHLASINVSVGQVVTHNTVIGYSGGVPSIETWDRCSTGAHLHLQLGTGAFMTDYIYYSGYVARKFDPRQIINFPAMGSYFSGR